MRKVGIAAFICFIATIWLANWLLQHYGIVDIAGVLVPAGVFAAGLAFTFRDIVHRTLGPGAAVLGIVIGASLSYLISPAFAGASAVAFLVSELADFSVYTPLEKRSVLGAFLASNVVGLVVDSALFLWIAFGSLQFIEGQVLGKLVMTALAYPVMLAIRPRLEPRAVLPRHA